MGDPPAELQISRHPTQNHPYVRVRYADKRGMDLPIEKVKRRFPENLQTQCTACCTKCHTVHGPKLHVLSLLP